MVKRGNTKGVLSVTIDDSLLEKFEKRGIFEKEIKPYLIKFSGLVKKDLKPLTKKDGGNDREFKTTIYKIDILDEKISKNYLFCYLSHPDIILSANI